MSTELQVSPQTQALLAADPALAARMKAMMEDATSGIGGAGPPRLSCNGTRFVVKSEGVETPVVYPPNYQVEELRGQPISTIPAIILGARNGFKKAWYAAKFTPGQEPKAPDCWSNDGVKPDPSSTLKQCESCAGCAQNAFGTGTDAQGDPSKGKACSDTKVLAVYFSPSVYELDVMPTALKGWKAYCKELSSYGAYLPFMVTKIGFNPETSFPSYVFSAGQQLDPVKMVPAVIEKMQSQEVKDILAGYTSAPQIPATPASQAAPPVAPPAPPAPAPPKPPKAPKAPPAPPVPPAQAADPLSSLTGEVQTPAGAAVPPGSGVLTSASDDDIAALLNL